MLQVTVMTQTASSTRTPEARRQSLCRAWKCMPKHAVSYADTIEDLISKVTPWKKTALEEHSVLSSTDQKEHAAVGEHVQTAIQDLSNKKDSGIREVRSVYLRILNKYGSMRHQSNCFAMNRKTLALSKKAKVRQAGNQDGICKTGDWCILRRCQHTRTRQETHEQGNRKTPGAVGQAD